MPASNLTHRHPSITRYFYGLFNGALVKVNNVKMDHIITLHFMAVKAL